ncbi:MAG: hypothetical protein CSA74_09805 [Rhodobacterales bacterium]|nr:MAG: hypothetical protein CSA74_09805 [Rhodobacterales bacterium]
MKKLTIAALTMIIATGANADHPAKGFIYNENGDKCWYHQSSAPDTYLHSIKANTRTLTFDDPECMVGTGLEFEINAKMIGNIITKPYSHDDARWQTNFEDLRDTSAMQVRGKCIQSATYPNVGVVVEFQVKDGFIRSVKHAPAAGECNDL